jgi:hypothetical protein
MESIATVTDDDLEYIIGIGDTEHRKLVMDSLLRRKSSTNEVVPDAKVVDAKKDEPETERKEEKNEERPSTSPAPRKSLSPLVVGLLSKKKDRIKEKRRRAYSQDFLVPPSTMWGGSVFWQGSSGKKLKDPGVKSWAELHMLLDPTYQERKELLKTKSSSNLDQQPPTSKPPL